MAAKIVRSGIRCFLAMTRIYRSKDRIFVPCISFFLFVDKETPKKWLLLHTLFSLIRAKLNKVRLFQIHKTVRYVKINESETIVLEKCLQIHGKLWTKVSVQIKLTTCTSKSILPSNELKSWQFILAVWLIITVFTSLLV